MVMKEKCIIPPTQIITKLFTRIFESKRHPSFLDKGLQFQNISYNFQTRLKERKIFKDLAYSMKYKRVGIYQY